MVSAVVAERTVGSTAAMNTRNLQFGIAGSISLGYVAVPAGFDKGSNSVVDDTGQIALFILIPHDSTSA